MEWKEYDLHEIRDAMLNAVRNEKNVIMNFEVFGNLHTSVIRHELEESVKEFPYTYDKSDRVCRTPENFYNKLRGAFPDFDEIELQTAAANEFERFYQIAVGGIYSTEDID